MTFLKKLTGAVALMFWRPQIRRLAHNPGKASSDRAVGRWRCTTPQPHRCYLLEKSSAQEPSMSSTVLAAAKLWANTENLICPPPDGYTLGVITN